MRVAPSSNQTEWFSRLTLLVIWLHLREPQLSSQCCFKCGMESTRTVALFHPLQCRINLVMYDGTAPLNIPRTIDMRIMMRYTGHNPAVSSTPRPVRDSRTHQLGLIRGIDMDISKAHRSYHYQICISTTSHEAPPHSTVLRSWRPSPWHKASQGNSPLPSLTVRRHLWVSDGS